MSSKQRLSGAIWILLLVTPALAALACGETDDGNGGADAGGEAGRAAGGSPSSSGNGAGGGSPSGLAGGPVTGGGGDDGTGGEPPGDAKFAVSSVVFSPEGETTYLSILDSLAPQTIDYTEAVELSGWGDMWVHEGYVYVSSGEAPTVTRYTVGADGALQESGQLSFANYGEVDVAFWSNTFVAPDKAYMIEGTSGYVIWDPLAMEITGTFELPALPERDGLIVRAGTLDRANVIRDGKLYQPMYWSDEDYARFAPDSRIAVIDIATDTVEATLEVPCGGLDIGTRDEAGNLYFSTWTSGVYEPLALGTPANCVARIPAGEDTLAAAFTYAEVAQGREGAAVRHFEGGRLLISIFHDEQADLATAEDPWALLGGANWRTWAYDPATDETAALVESIDWNSGATYVFDAGGEKRLLVPDVDYAATSVVTLHSDLTTTAAFDLRGWGIRLFQVR